MKKYAAELVGTFVLVFGGVGAAVFDGKHIGFMGIAFAFGLAQLIMCYAVGPISGCHINPAVTFGAWLSRRIGFKDVIGYWIAQLIGGILAAGVVLCIAHGIAGGYSAAASGLASNGYGAHSPDQYSMIAGFVAELVMTAIFVLVVLGSTAKKAPTGFAGLAIGFALATCHLVILPVTNTSVNPARALGPAVWVGGWAIHQVWLFFVAPLIGGAVAALVYWIIRTPDEPTPALKAESATN